MSDASDEIRFKPEWDERRQEGVIHFEIGTCAGCNEEKLSLQSFVVGQGYKAPYVCMDCVKRLFEAARQSYKEQWGEYPGSAD